MKTPAQARGDIARRISTTWHTDLAGTSTSWPHTFPLGRPAKGELETDFAGFHRRVVDWQDWAARSRVTLVHTTRRVHGTSQRIPTHFTIPTLDAAASLAGPDWVARLARARNRQPHLASRMANTETLAKLVRRIDSYSDIDFSILLTVADWFASTPAHQRSGLTPRQLPIPGVHAKWLNTHQCDILALTGLDTLGLLPPHPPRIHFTYLDPQHRDRGGRWHDSATAGDGFAPAYTPTVVLISENKDTAICFPTIPGGIAVEGEGFGGKAAAQFSWLTSAPHLYYWGDIDTHGYEILNGWRRDGVPVTSLLMDPVTYDTYEGFGTNTSKDNKPLTGCGPKKLTHLTSHEEDVYQQLCDPAWARHRRIEQERIPLADAAEALLAALGAT